MLISNIQIQLITKFGTAKLINTYLKARILIFYFDPANQMLKYNYHRFPLNFYDMSIKYMKIWISDYHNCCNTNTMSSKTDYNQYRFLLFLFNANMNNISRIVSGE